MVELFAGFDRMDVVDIDNIRKLIYVVRGQRIMLDEDLARIYGVPVKALNQQVKRNPSLFPEDFMFRLTADESNRLRSQFVTLEKSGRGKYRKYWPLAFTQVGANMLSSVLRSPRGIEVNIAIMRAFVKMQNAVLADATLAMRMERAELALEGLEKEQGEHATAIHELFAALRRLTEG